MRKPGVIQFANHFGRDKQIVPNRLRLPPFSADYTAVYARWIFSVAHACTDKTRLEIHRRHGFIRTDGAVANLSFSAPVYRSI